MHPLWYEGIALIGFSIIVVELIAVFAIEGCGGWVRSARLGCSPFFDGLVLMDGWMIVP